MRLATYFAFATVPTLCLFVAPPAQAAIVFAQQAVSHASGFNNFTLVPNLSNSDYADVNTGNGATASVIAGPLHGLSGPASLLLNGVGQTANDSPGESTFSDAADVKFLIDLQTSIFVTQVNSYSRHTNSRTPQVYNLYASNALVAPSAASTTLAGLVSAGWTHLVSVNTNATTGASFDGISGVSVFDNASPTASIGLYHFLLLQPTLAGTFYGEIDVVGAPPVPEPSTFALLGLGAIGLAIRTRRRHVVADGCFAH